MYIIHIIPALQLIPIIHDEGFRQFLVSWRRRVFRRQWPASTLACFCCCLRFCMYRDGCRWLGSSRQESISSPDHVDQLDSPHES